MGKAVVGTSSHARRRRICKGNIRSDAFNHQNVPARPAWHVRKSYRRLSKASSLCLPVVGATETIAQVGDNQEASGPFRASPRR